MKILHVTCSPRPDSHSRQLSTGIVERLLQKAPNASVCNRDLGFEPLPHTSFEYAAAVSSPAAMAAAPPTAWELSEILIGEVEAADVIVVGTPINNFTIPSVLKAWIDQILRIGRTIVSTPQGKVGTLRDRPVYIGVASGGVYTGENANQPDFLTPYLLAAFECVGIKDLRFFPLQATAFLDPKQIATARDEMLATGRYDIAQPVDALSIGAEETAFERRSDLHPGQG